ncbi:unnamed protein product [Bathycoccus prasinos]
MRFNVSSGGPFSLSALQQHRPNCLCCVGQPDPAFEKAIENLKRLSTTPSTTTKHLNAAVKAVEEEEGGREEGAAKTPSFAKPESISGINQTVAESFVRMCRSNGSGKMRLSKSKQKVAMKLKMKFEARLFTAEEIERMQEAVLEAYEETLDLEEKKMKT